MSREHLADRPDPRPSPTGRDRSWRQDRTPLAMLASTMSRTSLLYALAMGLVIPFGIVSLAFTTRYVDPSDYGRLAVLMALASAMTIIANTGAMHGTLLLVYGMAGEGDADDPMSSAMLPGAGPYEKRRIMGSGLLVQLLFVIVLCGGAALLAAPTAALFLHSTSYASWVRWTCLCAAFGTFWRMILQTFRFDRRVVGYVGLSGVRPALVVAFTIIMLILHHGVWGVLAATAAGNAVSLAIAIFISRDHYLMRPHPRDLKVILLTGWRYVFVTFALFAHSNADVLVLSQVGSARQLGLYGVARRIAQIPGYVSNGFLLAWPPMERSTIAKANTELTGRPPFAATMFTYLMIVTITMYVGVSLGADVLVHVAAPSYSQAAKYIPIISLSLTAYVAYYGLYRGCSFPNRLNWLAIVSVISAGGYAAGGALLAQRWGIDGVCAAGTAAWLSAGAFFYALDRRGGVPLPLHWGRVFWCAGLGVGAVAAQRLLPAADGPRVALDVGIAIVFGLLIVATGVLRVAQLKRLIEVVAQMYRPRRGRMLMQRVHSLPDHERRAIVELVGKRRALEHVAEQTKVAPDILLARVVRGLRRCNNELVSTRIDHHLGRYLLYTTVTFDRDDQANWLRDHDIGFLQLHDLEESVALLRSVPPRRWVAQEKSPRAAAHNRDRGIAALDAWRGQRARVGT
jgi:O-antigen/teichoic acid export membrane protein